MARGVWGALGLSLRRDNIAETLKRAVFSMLSPLLSRSPLCSGPCPRQVFWALMRALLACCRALAGAAAAALGAVFGGEDLTLRVQVGLRFC